MGLEFWALTFDFVGKVLLVAVALLVHRRVRKEHRIDKKVLKQMRVEQVTGILALVFLTLGYVLRLSLIN